MKTDSRMQVQKTKMAPLIWVVLLLSTCLTGLLIWTVLKIPRPLPSLAPEVANRLAASGVDNSVTAVLLNFRGYDTMLEVMVFLLGAITIWSIGHAPFPPKIQDTSPIQTAAVRLLAPFVCIIGGYLVWQGASHTGGAFQGGAVLSAGLVLLLISDFLGVQRVKSLPLRLGFTLGPLVFVGMALWGIIDGGSFLSFAPYQAGALLLLLEAACAVSIGLTLAAFFAGGRPLDDLREEPYSPGQDEGEG